MLASQSINRKMKSPRRTRRYRSVKRRSRSRSRRRSPNRRAQRGGSSEELRELERHFKDDIAKVNRERQRVLDRYSEQVTQYMLKIDTTMDPGPERQKLSAAADTLGRMIDFMKEM